MWQIIRTNLSYAETAVNHLVHVSSVTSQSQGRPPSEYKEKDKDEGKGMLPQLQARVKGDRLQCAKVWGKVISHKNAIFDFVRIFHVN